MSTIQNLTEGMANADALVADQMQAVVICETCKNTLTVAEIQAQLEHGDGEVIGLCDACANAPNPQPQPQPPATDADEVAKLKAEMAMLKAQVAEQEAKDKAAQTAKVLAEMRAENARLKAGNAAKANGKPAAAPQVATQVAAPQVATTQGLLPTDCRLGVIDPKHLTAGDKFLLNLLLQNRTKAEKLTKVGAIPGCLAVKLFHFFGPKGCNFSWDKTNSILAEAMSRNVISKMYFTNSKTGKEMITYFDAQWRPNIKRADDRPAASDVTLAKALFGEATK